jgi:8-oxo-dGTP pyrophosphatase MutT (NUDIX family)
VRLRRCYIKLFAMFERAYFGMIFEGVQVLVSNHDHQILICRRDPSRESLGKYDLGAGGMISFPHTPEETARDELHEELGLSEPIQYKTTLTPANGCNCIIHVYETEIDNVAQIRCMDGTYVGYQFYSLPLERSLYEEIKHDGRVILDHVYN